MPKYSSFVLILVSCSTEDLIIAFLINLSITILSISNSLQLLKICSQTCLSLSKQTKLNVILSASTISSNSKILFKSGSITVLSPVFFKIILALTTLSSKSNFSTSLVSDLEILT